MDTQPDLRQLNERERASAPQESHAPARGADAALSRLAATVGNLAFSAFARAGAGLLPGGRVHPDVEQAIARTRGAGLSLDRGVRDRVAPMLGDSLTDVRVHTDSRADELTRSVSARAFTTGTDIYFGAGEYRPGSSAGDELIAHELTHVVQQRGASTSGPLTVTEPGDALEADAEATARELG